MCLGVATRNHGSSACRRTDEAGKGERYDTHFWCGSYCGGLGARDTGAARGGAVLPAAPPPDPAAPVGGAIAGGVLGGIIGGALGHGPGAVAGAIIGGTTGAVIASEAQARPGGYFWWRGGCYYRYPDGAWSQPLYPSYCGY